MVKLTGRDTPINEIILEDDSNEGISDMHQRLMDKIERLETKVRDLKGKNKELEMGLKEEEEFLEIEQIFLEKMFTAYVKQYPLVSKGKNPDRYKANHKMAASLKPKLIRKGVLPHD